MSCWGYRFHGDSQKPTLVLLHGFLANQRDWDAVLPALTEDFYCLTIDLPGHGQTTIDEPHQSLPLAAQSLNELLDRLHVSRCHLLGYSMGGRLALQVYLLNPARYASLILEGSCPGLKTEAEQLERVKHDGYIARQIEKESDDFRGYLLKWYQQPFFKTIKSNAECFEHFLSIRLQNDPFKVAQSLRSLSTGAQPSLWERLADVSCPSLLIVGQNDSKFFQFAEDMRQGIPLAQLHVEPECGHNVHVENPSQYVRILTQFLSQVMEKL